MKWKTYQQLTPEQREEWTFRFSKKEYPLLSINGLGFVWLGMSLFIMIALMAMKEYVTYNGDIAALLVYAAVITKWWVCICFGEHLVYALSYLGNTIVERRWIKKCLTQK